METGSKMKVKIVKIGNPEQIKYLTEVKTLTWVWGRFESAMVFTKEEAEKITKKIRSPTILIKGE